MSEPAAKPSILNGNYFSLGAFIAIVGGVISWTSFSNSQSDRISADARSRTEMQAQLNGIERQIQMILPRIEILAGLQGKVDALVASTARMEAAMGPFDGRIRDVERAGIEVRAAISGSIKDVESVRAEVTGIKVDMQRGRDATASQINQIREWMFRPPMRGGMDMAPGPGLWIDPPLMAAPDRPRRVDYQSVIGKPLL